MAAAGRLVRSTPGARQRRPEGRLEAVERCRGGDRLLVAGDLAIVLGDGDLAVLADLAPAEHGTARWRARSPASAGLRQAISRSPG
jgi:hypothetical protein